MSVDEQAIRTLVSLWHTATAAGDVETVLGLIAEDVVFIVPGHPPMTGRSTFERGLRGLLAQHRIESTSDVQEIGISGAAATVRAGSALSILRKQSDGKWMVVRDANLLAVKA